MNHKLLSSVIEVVSGILLGLLIFMGLVSAVSSLWYNPKADSNEPYFVYQGY